MKSFYKGNPFQHLIKTPQGPSGRHRRCSVSSCPDPSRHPLVVALSFLLLMHPSSKGPRGRRELITQIVLSSIVKQVAISVLAYLSQKGKRHGLLAQLWRFVITWDLTLLVRQDPHVGKSRVESRHASCSNPDQAEHSRIRSNKA